MSQLLEKAVAEARTLPIEDQDALGTWMLEEIEDDRRWEASFAQSPEKLITMAARAAEQVKSGQCRVAGFDEL